MTLLASPLGNRRWTSFSRVLLNATRHKPSYQPCWRTRRCLQTQQFQPFAPPSPSSLPKPGPPKVYRRLRKWTRRLVYLAIGTGVLYAVDQRFIASSLTRSARTFGVGLVVATDYKINFRPHPPLAESIAALHVRNAERLFDLLRANGGLYLKIGQAIAMQSAILPPEFQKMFAKMFDDAPQNTWKDVEQVIREDFGKSPEEVFGVSFKGDPGKGLMERTATASASVAQVHWARLQDGREVAVKVQKKEIAQQVGWDLWTFKYYVFFSPSASELTDLRIKGCHVHIYHPLRSSIVQPRALHFGATLVRDRFRERSRQCRAYGGTGGERATVVRASLHTEGIP